MQRAAFACCALACGSFALVACKGSSSPPPEDKRAPAQAPIAPLDEIADASPPDAPSLPCYAVPPDPDAERAGIRRLTHRAGGTPLPRPSSPQRDVTVLKPGSPTLVRGLAPASDGTLSVAPGIGADAVTMMARIDKQKVTLTAPAHLDGAVLGIRGATSAILAIGPQGVALLAKYRSDYVTPRKRDRGRRPEVVAELWPLAIVRDDLDGDGTLELISYSEVRYEIGTGDTITPIVELGVLWGTGAISSFELCCESQLESTVYLAPLTHGGGKPMLFTLDGLRYTVGGGALNELPSTRPEAGQAACLQTSENDPGVLRAR